MIILFILLLGSYLLGSTPSAILLGKYFYNVDICSVGSKNPGTTNVYRILGLRAALLVFCVDVLKGLLSTQLVWLLPYDLFCKLYSGDWQIILGLFAFIGHIYPYGGLIRGGKGVATAFGIILGLNMLVAFISFVVFLLVVRLSRYVSLGSIIASISLLVTATFSNTNTVIQQVFYTVISLTVIICHTKNIRRLCSGKEKKIIS